MSSHGGRDEDARWGTSAVHGAPAPRLSPFPKSAPSDAVTLGFGIQRKNIGGARALRPQRRGWAGGEASTQDFMSRFQPKRVARQGHGQTWTRGSLGRDVCERKAGWVTRPARGRRSRGGRTAGRRRRDLAVAWAPRALVFCPRGAPEGGPQVPTQELRVHRGPRPLGRPGRQLEAGRGEGPRIAHGLCWGDGDTASHRLRAPALLPRARPLWGTLGFGVLASEGTLFSPEAGVRRRRGT